ncbi:hypothetical protein F5B20DRAFT_597369 [Whalleya microplaca]|nr:hypothetical protein F5B20DRAFT_597369 [Whalleya microplaca]
MSFGWSASDIGSAIKFLNSLRKALKESGGAAERFQEDQHYLIQVSCVLEKVSWAAQNGLVQQSLAPQVQDIAANVNSLRGRLTSFESSIMSPRLGLIHFFKRQSKKIQYGIYVSEEVQKFRTRTSEQLHALQLVLGLSTATTASQLQTKVSAITTNINSTTALLGTRIDQQTSMSSKLATATNVLGAKLDAETTRLTAADKQVLHTKVLAWLNPVMTFEEKHRSCLKDMLPGSCDWIFSKQAYIDWYQPATIESRSLLWVTGIPGAGKTMLASRFIQLLQDRHYVIYFYCEARTERSRTTASILCTWSWQILHRNTDLLDDVVDIYLMGAEPYAGSMKLVFYKLVQADPNTIIVLDGLDECDPASRRELCEIVAWLSGITRIVIFSRYLGDICESWKEGSTPEKLVRLEMTQCDTEAEIKRFIEFGVESLPQMDVESKQEIASSLQRKASGMFLWADLMIKQLRKGWFDIEDCLEAIEEMPNDLNVLYCQILRKLHAEAGEHERHQSKAILSWLVCSQRPLKLLEVVLGCKMQNRLGDFEMRKNSVFCNTELERVLSRRCGPLTRVTEDDNGDVVVTLVHATAKEFLMGYEMQGEPFEGLLVNVKWAHALIARSCLTYICYNDIEFCPFDVTWVNDGCPETWDDMGERLQQHLRRYPLLEYATVHWADHLASGSHDENTAEELQRLCSSEARTIKWLQIFLRLRGDRGAFRTSPALTYLDHLKSLKNLPFNRFREYQEWLRHLSGPDGLRFERWERFMSSGGANDFLQPLHIAAFFDFSHFIETDLHNGSDVNQRTVDGQTPLHLAARGDALDSGCLLLDYGADINAIGWSSNTPLNWAIDVECYTSCSKSGPFLMAELLLSRGADPTLVPDSLPPLTRICDVPRSDDPFILGIVKEIFDRGVSKYVNGYPDHRSPLASAAKHGSSQLMRLLLQYGACPDGGLEGNRFQRALRNPLLVVLEGNRNPDIIRVLLENGANPNVTEPDGRSALHLCTRAGLNSTELALLLLRYGADVNSQASDLSTPLHDAVAEGKLGDIRLLIDYGAGLEVENGTGHTPLTLTLQHNNQAAANLLLGSGARAKGAAWRVTRTVTGQLELFWEESRHIPGNFKQLLEVYWILRYRGLRSRTQNEILPRHLVLSIMENARYWLKSEHSADSLEEYDEERAALGTAYLLTEPIQLAPYCVIQQVRISIRSHDQGWSSHSMHHGTYEGSYTWFEVGIQKSDGRWLDLNFDERLITRNIHASSQSRTHCIIFSHDDSTGTSSWTTLLELGDRVAVLPKAQFQGWVNYVQSANIEIFTSIGKDPRLYRS